MLEVKPFRLFLALLAATLPVSCQDDSPPPAPSGVNAISADGAVSVSWTPDTSATAIAYELSWGTDSANLTDQARISSSPPHHEVTGLQNGTTYYFALIAISGSSKRSEPSQIVSATPMPDTSNAEAPTITATVPRAQSSSVSLHTPFQIAFSKTMDTGSLKVTSSPALTFGAFSWILNDTIVNFQTSAPLVAGTTYQITLSARSIGGVEVAGGYHYMFSTPVPPTVVGTNPANGATASPAPASFFITFSQRMYPGDDGFPISITPDYPWEETWSSDSKTLRITRRDFNQTGAPPIALTLGGNYSVTVLGNALSTAGIPIAAPYSFNFHVTSTPDTTAPTIVAVSPANGTTNVDPTSPLQVQFSEAMNEASVAAALTLSAPTGYTLASGSSLDGTLFTFTPTQAWPQSGTVTFQVGTGAKDVAGNSLATATTVSFTTP